eukprot:1624628-Ditylum_brightwellii.AAC.1
MQADFDPELLFHTPLVDPIEKSNRKLISTNPKCREKYVTIIKKHFKENTIQQRVKSLAQDMTAEVLPLSILIDCYEALDKKITQLMLVAEKKCHKATPGHAWSLQL